MENYILHPRRRRKIPLHLGNFSMYAEPLQIKIIDISDGTYRMDIELLNEAQNWRSARLGAIMLPIGSSP